MGKSFEDVEKGSVVEIAEFDFNKMSMMIKDDIRIVLTESGKAIVLEEFQGVTKFVVTDIIPIIQPSGFIEKLKFEKEQIDKKVIGVRAFLSLMGDTPMNNLFNQQAQIPHLDFEAMELVKQQLRNLVDLSDTLEQRITYSGGNNGS